ncbi:MAG TPA: hypothetical protein VEB40_10045 [Flavipsychrobacter sp.]|nr:hypothetical protein [Flavipsychrobacter sp.]
MTFLRLCKLLICSLFLLLTSCKKWSFNNKIKGEYTGTWESPVTYYKNYPQRKVVSDVVIVTDYKKKEFAVWWTNRSRLNEEMRLEYNGSNQYEYQHVYVSSVGPSASRNYSTAVYKLVFNPKSDSLTINTSGWSDNPVFRGRRK